MMQAEQHAATTTTLHRNPFFVLKATTRDTSNRIIELEREHELSDNADECQKARADLISPRLRLSAEVGWFPGLAPRRAQQALESLESTSASAFAADLPALARANLLAASLEIAEPTAHTAKDGIQELATAVSEIDPAAVMRDINEDRAMSIASEDVRFR